MLFRSGVCHLLEHQPGRIPLGTLLLGQDEDDERSGEKQDDDDDEEDLDQGEAGGLAASADRAAELRNGHADWL